LALQRGESAKTDFLPKVKLRRMRGAVIPRLTDQNRWAQSREPMDLMVQG